MQTLGAFGAERGRVVVFVPRWIPPGVSVSGMPYKVFPILSSLARHGFEVVFCSEAHDGMDAPPLREALQTAVAAVAWCAEMNPGTQIAGLLAFLRLARESAPQAIRACGGAFFYLIPDQVQRLDDPGVEVFPRLGRSDPCTVPEQASGGDGGCAIRSSRSSRESKFETRSARAARPRFAPIPPPRGHVVRQR